VAQQPELPDGYLWEEIATDIYLVTQENPVAAVVDGNSVVIVNDRDVVVVDTHLVPRVARAVIARIRALTDKPVHWVINTHWHDDHNNGNQSYRDQFPGLEILAHENTAGTLSENATSFLEQRRQSYGRILQMAEEGAFEWDDPSLPPDAARQRMVLRAYIDALVPELDSMQVVLPTMTFKDRLVLERGNREIQVLYLGEGNTDGDAVVYLPRERVLITGDLVIHPIPFGYDIYFEEWVATLDRLIALDADLIIPGHGGVLRDEDYMRQMQGLLRFVLERSREAHAAGVSREQLLESEVWREWEERFAGDDQSLRWAFRTYFLGPALEQAFENLQVGENQRDDPLHDLH
jgi:glyoxylase-like metal-dependent hydrolase (beta-lactamase superfamily II)